MYYVYIIVDKDNIPFYVGKGTGDRYQMTLYRGNKHKINKIKRIKKETNTMPDVIILYNNLSNDVACEKEIELIGNIGLVSLTNYHCGGEGGDTLTNHPDYNSIVKRMSETRSGKNNPNYGRCGVNSPNYGRKNSILQNKHLSEGKFKYILYLKSPIGVEYVVDKYYIFKELCKEHNLSTDVLRRVCAGSKKHYKGWTGSRELKDKNEC